MLRSISATFIIEISIRLQENHVYLDIRLEKQQGNFLRECLNEEENIRALLRQLGIDENPEIYTKAAASRKIGELLKQKEERRQQILSIEFSRVPRP